MFKSNFDSIALTGIGLFARDSSPKEALKITPAHDFNDYDVGQRNKLDIINIFTEEGKINDNAPSDYIGLDRFDARKKLLNELKEKDFFVKEEDIKNKVPYGDRSNSIIEPFLT